MVENVIIAALKENRFKPTENDKEYQVFKDVSRTVKGIKEEGALKVGIKLSKGCEPCGAKNGDIIVATRYEIKGKSSYGSMILPFPSSTTAQKILDYINSDIPMAPPIHLIFSDQ